MTFPPSEEERAVQRRAFPGQPRWPWDNDAVDFDSLHFFFFFFFFCPCFCISTWSKDPIHVLHEEDTRRRITFWNWLVFPVKRQKRERERERSGCSQRWCLVLSYTPTVFSPLGGWTSSSLGVMMSCITFGERRARSSQPDFFGRERGRRERRIHRHFPRISEWNATFRTRWTQRTGSPSGPLNTVLVHNNAFFILLFSPSSGAIQVVFVDLKKKKTKIYFMSRRFLSH